MHLWDEHPLNTGNSNFIHGIGFTVGDHERAKFAHLLVFIGIENEGGLSSTSVRKFVPPYISKCVNNVFVSQNH